MPAIWDSIFGNITQNNTQAIVAGEW